MRLIRYSLKQTVAPTSEPITSAQAKTHLHIDSDDSSHDTYVGELITAARIIAEQKTNRQLMLATYRLSMDGFPGANDPIYLPRPPLSSITSIAYTDENGDAQTLTVTTEYQLNSDEEPAYIVPARNTSWPAILDQTVKPIQITYVAGYSNAAAVPQNIKNGMYLLIGHWFENRESVMPMTMNEVPMAAEALFAASWVPGINWYEMED